MEVVVSTVHITNLVDVGFDCVLKLESNHASQGRQVTVGDIYQYIKGFNAFYDTDEKAFQFQRHWIDIIADIIGYEDCVFQINLKYFQFQLQPVYVPRRKRSQKL